MDCVIVALAVQTDLPPTVNALVVESRPIDVGEYVQVWGHPNTDDRPFQQSAGRVTRITNSTLHYRASTLDGFSGSPVTSIDSGRLVALHCAGPSQAHPEAGNTGTSITAIMDAFTAQFPVFSIMAAGAGVQWADLSGTSGGSPVSPSPSSTDLLCMHRQLHRTFNATAASTPQQYLGVDGRRDAGPESLSPVDRPVGSAVAAYPVPVADSVALVSMAEARTVGYAVAGSVEAARRDPAALGGGGGGDSWAELAATAALGLVPVFGPLCNSLYHTHRGQYLSAAVDLLCAGVDLCSVLTAAAQGGDATSGGSAAGAGTRIVLRESGQAIGELCAKKLLLGAARRLVASDRAVVGALVQHGKNTAVRRTAQRFMLQSALVKTTACALSSATSAYDRPADQPLRKSVQSDAGEGCECSDGARAGADTAAERGSCGSSECDLVAVR